MNTGHVRKDFPKAKHKDYWNHEWDLFVYNVGAKINLRKLTGIG